MSLLLIKSRTFCSVNATTLDESVAYLQITHVHSVASADNDALIAAAIAGLLVVRLRGKQVENQGDKTSTALLTTAAARLATDGAGAPRTGHELSTNVSQFVYETLVFENDHVAGVDNVDPETKRVLTMGKRCVLLTGLDVLR